jgi:malonyl-CoA O-methyltransferase
MEYLQVQYPNIEKLISDLRMSGSQNAHHLRLKGLMGKNRWRAVKAHYETFRKNDKLPVTVEIIYGHAWIPEKKFAKDTALQKEIVVPIASITRRTQHDKNSQDE